MTNQRSGTMAGGNRQEQLDTFFNRYADRFNAALKHGKVDADVTAQNFADCFVEASPVGISCGKNDDEFRRAIPEGYSFYKKIGITSMNIRSKDITVLDDFHAMVKINWRSEFTKKDNTSGGIDFAVFYFVQTSNDTHKIFAYVTGDEQAALKENGLI